MEAVTGGVTSIYRFLSGGVPAVRLLLKAEINIRDHFAALGFAARPFSVESRWYSRRTVINAFELDELLATKMRALYQRRKGRGLFDLASGLADGRRDATRIVEVSRKYMELKGASVTRAVFERNPAAKIGDAEFSADMGALLRPGFEWRPTEASRTVFEQLVTLLPGEPWKGGQGCRAGAERHDGDGNHE